MTPLVPDRTRRDTVAKGKTARYSAGVGSGTYVISVSGIVGAAALKVYDDAALQHPTACLAPNNIESSTFAQPADCSFTAHGGTVYAAVTGRSYLALPRNTYNIRVSAAPESAAGNQGTQESPMAIQPDRPIAGGTGLVRGDASYYVVKTAGSGDAVVSITGMTGEQYFNLFIYETPDFTRWLDGPRCFTGQQLTYPEDCALPAGKTYYIKVMSYNAGSRSFTLMVDTPVGVINGGSKGAAEPAVTPVTPATPVTPVAPPAPATPTAAAPAPAPATVFQPRRAAAPALTVTGADPLGGAVAFAPRQVTAPALTVTGIGSLTSGPAFTPRSATAPTLTVTGTGPHP